MISISLRAPPDLPPDFVLHVASSVAALGKWESGNDAGDGACGSATVGSATGTRGNNNCVTLMSLIRN